MDELRDHWALALGAVAIAVTTLLYAEWHTDEPTVVLAVLLLVSGAAGWVVPRRALIAGLCIGPAILLAHALSNTIGLMVPAYQRQAPSVADWAVMAMLVLPSLTATVGGSLLRRRAAARRPARG